MAKKKHTTNCKAERIAGYKQLAKKGGKKKSVRTKRAMVK